MKNAVAEIVTFALADTVDPAAFVEISKGTESFVRSLPGFVHRQLSLGEDGRWTDYVIWDSMEAARSAAEAFMKAECAAALMTAIAPDTVKMRHEKILWKMAA